MKLNKETLKQIILEELSKAGDLLDKFLKKELHKEIEKHLKGKATKEEIVDIAKKVIKKLYRELTFNYPYLIDRMKL